MGIFSAMSVPVLLSGALTPDFVSSEQPAQAAANCLWLTVFAAMHAPIRQIGRTQNP